MNHLKLQTLIFSIIFCLTACESSKKRHSIESKQPTIKKPEAPMLSSTLRHTFNELNSYFDTITVMEDTCESTKIIWDSDEADEALENILTGKIIENNNGEVQTIADTKTQTDFSGWTIGGEAPETIKGFEKICNQTVMENNDNTPIDLRNLAEKLSLDVTEFIPSNMEFIPMTNGQSNTYLYEKIMSDQEESFTIVNSQIVSANALRNIPIYSEYKIESSTNETTSYFFILDNFDLNTDHYPSSAPSLKYDTFFKIVVSNEIIQFHVIFPTEEDSNTFDALKTKPISILTEPEFFEDFMPGKTSLKLFNNAGEHVGFISTKFKTNNTYYLQLLDHENQLF